MKVTSRMYRSTVPLLLLVAAVAGGVAFAQGQQQVEFWIVWDQIGQFREILAPFHEANPDISVNVSLSPQGVALRERLTVAVAGGAPPDLVLVVSPAADMMMSGLFLELDEFIAASETIGPEAYPPGLFELFSWDGHQYAVPGIEGGPWSGLVVNERLLAEVGLVEPPQTLEDLQTYHRRLTRYEDDQLVRIGFSPLNAMTGTYPADIWTRIFDVSLYDPETQTIRVNTPEMVAVMEYIQQFYEVMPINDTEVFHQQYGWFSAMNSNILAMEINGYWSAGSYRNHADPIAFTWVPTVHGDTFMVLGTWAMAIPRGAAHPETAFKVIEYLSSPAAVQEIFNRLGYLNTNLTAVQNLDWSAVPDIGFFIRSIAEANRYGLPENIPNMSNVRSELTYAMRLVGRREATIPEALANAEARLNAQLREMLGPSN